MILKDSLYKITSSDLEEKSFNIELVPDCLIYNAHFPKHPITPGVCIIQIATELLNELLQGNCELTSISNAKFLAVIDPIENTTLTYCFKKFIFYEETKTAKVSVVVCNSETIFTKLSLAYKKR